MTLWMIAGCATLTGDQVIALPEGNIEVSQIDRQGPVVVFESGIGGHKETWNKVFDVIGATHTVLAYDRPGIGRSEPTSRPRDAETIVEDLREILRSRNLPKPYVLVGHSAGGLYLQLFARRYPDEVAGLVLVDPTHPTHFAGEGDISNRSLLSKALVAVAFSSTAKAEFSALTLSGTQVLDSPPLRADMPALILIAPDRSNTRIAAFDNEKRKDFARLYPSAELREVDSGHQVPQVKPQLVVEAIQEVLARVMEIR